MSHVILYSSVPVLKEALMKLWYSLSEKIIRCHALVEKQLRAMVKLKYGDFE